MCGIFCCLGCVGEHGRLKAKLLGNLVHRGPDFTGEVIIPLSDGKELYLLATVLGMRGKMTPQPFAKCESVQDQNVQDQGQNYLLWNGNVFGGEIQVNQGENDTVKVYEQMCRDTQGGGNPVLLTLSGIHGPWAFVLWQESTRSLWFGRDVFGRRSLVWHLPDSPADVFVLSSVACREQEKDYWMEVPASCVYQLKCGSTSHSLPCELVCYPWIQSGECFQNESAMMEKLASLKTCLKVSVQKDTQLQVPFPPLNKTLPQTRAECTGDKAVSLQPCDPHERRHEQQDQLQGGCTGDTKQQAVGVNLCDSGPKQRDQLCVHGGCTGDTKQETVGSPQRDCAGDSKQQACLHEDVDWKHLAEEFLEVLANSVDVRVHNAPSLPSCEVLGSIAAENEQTLSPSPVSSPVVVLGRAKVGVLFSGGVDSMVLAALVDRCLPLNEEVDLINVAFEDKRLSETRSKFAVPDRISAVECLKELNPDRKWNLVKVDVTADEVNTLRVQRVSQLIYPLCTVLDDSIGCALWFGARGRGTLYGQDDSAALYQSQVRTLLIGIGADEQLGGYSRHRTKYRSEGWQGLLEELEKDCKRIAQRNLGRDDRCVADHCREGQFPFLDENVVAHLQQLPIWKKVDLSLPRGIGEKRLLREAAVLLGCRTASKLPKRAIQFGSRIAKLSGSSGGRESGSDKCSRLT